MIRGRPLFWQLFPAFGVVVLLVLLAVATATYRTVKHFFISRTQTELKATCRLLRLQLAPLLAPPVDTAAVEGFCDLVAQHSETRLTVMLVDGRVIGESTGDPATMDNHRHRPEMAAALAGREGVSVRRSTTLKQRMMYVALPVENGPQPAAVVRTALPLGFIQRELADLNRQLLVWGVVIAVLVVVLSVFLTRRITRPVRLLQESARRFAGGELAESLAVTGSLELADLAETLNQMARQLQERLSTIRSQRNELQAVFSSMREGVVAIDGRETVFSLNPAAADMLNLTAVKVHNRPLTEVVRNAEFLRVIRRVLADGRAQERDVVVYDRQETVINVRCTPLAAESSTKPHGVLAVFNDVTHYRRLENMRRDFAANVSHEIKTPLTAIKGFVETLLQGADAEPEERHKFLGIIEKNVQRLAAIIEDLLSLSRIEQVEGIGDIRRQHTAISDVVQNAVQVCRPKAESKRIEILVDCADDLAMVVDPLLLEQALVNLLDNAVKYSNSDSRIDIGAAAADSEMLLTVRDHGIGIEKKHLARLFERFYRVDKARSRKLGGTGLGLAIVKHIVQAHNGRVTVDSRIGEGSTFTIHLPWIDRPDEPPPPPRPEPTAESPCPPTGRGESPDR